MSDEALLLLSATGKIQFANAAAGQMWQIGAEALIGDAFSNLFVFEVTSSDPEWLETQWLALLETGRSANGVVLSAQPRMSPPFEAKVRIEKAHGAEGACFLAHIRKATAADAIEAGAPAAPRGPASRFDPLVARSNVGFFDLDFGGRQFFYSPTWKNLLGFLDQDLPDTESTWRDLVHEEDSDAAPDKADRKYPHQTRPFSAELRMRTKQGPFAWVLASGIQVFDAEGSLSRVLGTMINIDERKEFEDACLLSEERLGLIGRGAELAAVDLDFAGNRAWYSAGVRKITGLKEAELNAVESFSRFLPPNERGSLVQHWFGTKSPGASPLAIAFTVVNREGDPVAVRGTFVRTFDKKRNLQRVTGFFTPDPVTPNAATPDLVAARAAIDSLSEGVVVADASGNIVLLNARSARLLGLKATDVIGRSAAELVPLVKRLGQQAVENPIQKVLSSGESVPMNDEHSIPVEHGLLRVVFSCEAIKDAKGAVQGAIFVFRDPEEMTLTPDELVRSNRFETLGLLAGGIAHDFNNLLTTILGGISIAREAKDYSQLEDSEKGCMAAKALTRQLLALARGGADLRQILNAGEILQESVRLASVGSAVKVDLQIASELHMIHADKAEIIRVFQNLIINSIQAMPSGSGNVWVRASNSHLNEGDVPPLAAGDYVHIEIQDNGCGIPPEHLEKIFEPFFTTKKTGTGLGLATVISIVKTHGGQVGVTSTVGVGTTFSIFLPRADQPVAEIQREAPTLRFGTGRILVMDDEEKILHLVGIMLENLGYKFDVARNGAEAVALYQRYVNVDRPYDCVILDLTIVGGMGGEETFKELKRIHPGVCAVISSGYDSEEMMNRYLNMGFRGYLSKPFRVGELGKLLRKVLGAPPGGAPSA